MTARLGDTRAPVRTRPRRFFALYAAFLLAAVILGFSRTLYLRPWFDDAPLRVFMLAHGVVLTAWFVLFLVQTRLAGRGRVVTHRRLGVLGVGIATLVVATSAAVIFDIVHAWRANGIDVDSRRQLLSLIVWGNLGALLAYATFIVRAVLQRRQADAHGRLMLLASISIASPALIRIAALPVFGGIDGIVLTMAGLLLLVGALVAHDLATLRRVHRETLWGVPFFLLAHLGAAFLLPGTPLDGWLMQRLW